MAERLVVLDTETTGRLIKDGHRLVEIGCVELIDRRRTGREFFKRVNPERPIDSGASEVHRIYDADVADAPVFSDIVEEFMSCIHDSTLVIHNAPFDLAFLNTELSRVGKPEGLQKQSVIDTLFMARTRHPGSANSLDALCRRYGVNASSRSDAHGALIDASLLADVYLAMTSCQSTMPFLSQADRPAKKSLFARYLEESSEKLLPVVRASSEEVERHEARMAAIHRVHLKKLEGKAVALRNEVKGLIEHLSVLERNLRLDDKRSVAAKKATEFAKKTRDILSRKTAYLEKAEEDLHHAKTQGQNSFENDNS